MKRTKRTEFPALPTFTRLLLATVLACPSVLPAQERNPSTGWEFTGLPAVNFDSDEGFGYGVILALYDYGPTGLLPYRTTYQPTLFFTTEGRRDLTLFFDAPHLPGGWRFSGFLGKQKQIATPYYGLGNDSVHDPHLEEGENPYFYRFGRDQSVFRVALQKRLGNAPVRLLLGGQLSRTTIDPTPKDEGTTLLQEQLGPLGPFPGGAENSLRGGLVWDTRSRESGPESGVWTEALVERVDKAFGSDATFTRWTLTDRRYYSLRPGLVLANRVTLQTVTGSPPFHALSFIQSSFDASEGLGGSKSLRGVLRNRYSGEGLFLWNLELRWRAKELRLLGKAAHLAFIGFVDSGRVWADGLELGSLLSELHHGFGGGARVGLGPNFVVAADLATSREVGLQLYIGLGYLF